MLVSLRSLSTSSAHYPPLVAPCLPPQQYDVTATVGTPFYQQKNRIQHTPHSNTQCCLFCSRRWWRLPCTLCGPTLQRGRAPSTCLQQTWWRPLPPFMTSLGLNRGGRSGFRSMTLTICTLGRRSTSFRFRTRRARSLCLRKGFLTPPTSLRTRRSSAPWTV